MVSIHALLAECDLLVSYLLLSELCFNPRTPCGVRRSSKSIFSNPGEFQSTHSLRSATETSQKAFATSLVSIHALLAECDGPQGEPGETGPVSIHALLAECDLDPNDPSPLWEVSIHALLAECDSFRQASPRSHHCFNPRTPCGVRPKAIQLLAIRIEFQSTHSLRSATCPQPRHRHRSVFQSTHSLRSATPVWRCMLLHNPVSIHALLAECDQCHVTQILHAGVSIHALLAECDSDGKPPR